MRPKAKRALARKRPTQKEQPRSVSLDYYVNALARTGWGTASLPEATEYNLIRLSNNYWLMISLYRNNWLIRRIVDLPAQDMTRTWPKIVSDMEPDDIQEFQRTIRRTYTPKKLRTAIKWARLFGGGGALMCIKGHENILDEPLDLDDVNPKSFLGLIPFNRWTGIQPHGTGLSEDFEKPLDWGLPEFYECTQQDRGASFRVHSSRIIRFTGPEVPTPEFQAQMYWGIGVPEVVYEDLRKKDNASFALRNSRKSFLA
jgi:phage-related protein (TIGR01555 family)